MNNPFAWASRELNRLSPNRMGLGLMTLGFLSAVVGALLAVVSAYLSSVAGNEESFVRHAVAWLGWVVMVAGAAVIAAGIIWHWVAMFSADRAKE